MTAYEVAFIGALFYRFSVLMPLLREHLDDYDGLLPHVLMGDVTRWVVEKFLSDATDNSLSEMLDFIESAFEMATEGDRQLISASFLENLPRTGPGAEVRVHVGPALQGQLQRIG